jgi:hypothetical protein
MFKPALFALAVGAALNAAPASAATIIIHHTRPAPRVVVVRHEMPAPRPVVVRYEEPRHHWRHAEVGYEHARFRHDRGRHEGWR